MLRPTGRPPELALAQVRDAAGVLRHLPPVDECGRHTRWLAADEDMVDDGRGEALRVQSAVSCPRHESADVHTSGEPIRVRTAI